MQKGPGCAFRVAVECRGAEVTPFLESILLWLPCESPQEIPDSLRFFAYM